MKAKQSAVERAKETDPVLRSAMVTRAKETEPVVGWAMVTRKVAESVVGSAMVTRAEETEPVVGYVMVTMAKEIGPVMLAKGEVTSAVVAWWPSKTGMDQPLNPKSPVDVFEVLVETVEDTFWVGELGSLPKQCEAVAGSELPERGGFSHSEK